MNRFACAAALAALPLGAVACAPPGAIGPTVGYERRAALLLAEANAHDQELMRRLLQAHLQTARTLLLGRIHREMISRPYFIADGSAAPSALEADLGVHPSPTALAEEVRAGHMTPDDARMFLENYSLAMRIRDDGATRRAMLARLGPVRRHDEAAAALERALAERAGAIDLLFDDLASSGVALERYATQSPAPGSAARAVSTSVAPRLIARRVRDPERRAAIENALKELIETTFPANGAREESEIRP